ncbi:MAG: UbiD family decarboxylase domain-containing protein [Planctomycetota bacterium]
MAYPSLRTFLDALDAAGELRRIAAPVSTQLEITEIADRISKSSAARLSDHAPHHDPVHHHLGGQALLFENVVTPRGQAACPLLINAWGSYRRVEMALGCEDGGLNGLAHRVAELVKPEPPTKLMDKVRKGLELAKIAALPPKVVKSGPCQEIVQQADDIDLRTLPILKCWPLDGDPTTVGYPLSTEQSGTSQGDGRYLTLAGVYTLHPDDAGKPDAEPRPSRNVGMYRAQLLDAQRTAMHWHVHHDGARHWRAWRKAHQTRDTGNPAVDAAPGMPCAIVLGGESVLPYAATAPLPPGISELIFAGFLHGSSIKLVKCKTLDLHVPAEAEIVIEGYVSTAAGPIGYDPRAQNAAPLDLQQEVFEGPFGDHTGFYSLPDRYPVFTATAVTTRRKPIYPTTVVGMPPQEDYYLGKATERIFLPLLQTLVPDIADYDLPMFGAFHNCVFVKIQKEYPFQARRVMQAIWGAGQMAWTKSIVVVDHDVDVHDHEAVLFHLCANCDPGRDIEVVQGPLDILDHAAPGLGVGSKIGFDATRKLPGESTTGQAVRDFPPVIEMDDATRKLVDQRWAEYGL